MFETLIETRRPNPRRLSERALSLALHAAIVLGAVRATAGAVPRATARPVAATATYTIITDRVRAPGAAATEGIPDGPMSPVLDPVPGPVIDGTLMPSVPVGPLFQGPGALALPGEPRHSGGGLAPVADSLAPGDAGPMLVSGAVPEYPVRLRALGVEGRVVLEFTVGTSGRALQGTFSVAEATDSEFVASAVQAMLNSRFRPAERAGRAVPARVRQTVWYRLRGSP